MSSKPYLLYKREGLPHVVCSHFYQKLLRPHLAYLILTDVQMYLIHISTHPDNGLILADSLISNYIAVFDR